MSDQEIPKVPNLELAQDIFILSSAKLGHLQNEALEHLLKGIKDENMAPLYKQLANEEDLKVPYDPELYEAMSVNNKTELAKIEQRIEDAQENLGETEISDALLAKADYLARIGDKDAAVSAYRIAFDKTTALGSRIDILFSYMRIGFFFNDNDLISKKIAKAKSLIEEGGDWDRRNRLKVYEAIYNASVRDFADASELLLSTLSTFTSTELMDYKDFISYAVLCSMVSLKRVDLKDKVLDAPEVLEVVSELPYIEDYMTSLYECKYAKFFQALASVEEKYFKTSKVLAPHARYYVREMRIRAYSQLLESYRSLTLESMAQAFGVSEGFIDGDLSRFISAGRLNCVVDKVNGIVETNRPDAKNAQYQQVVKQGDLLLNRIQKLSRVINA